MNQKEKQIVEEENEQSHGRCPLDCFLFRLFCVIATFGLLVAVFGITIVQLDKFDIVQRSLLYFKPYASSLPWILMMICVTLLLCIPNVTAELHGLMNRIDTIGTIKFFKRKDMDSMKEATEEIEESARKDGMLQMTEKEKSERVIQRTGEIKELKRKIVKIHGEQINATLVDYDVGIIGQDLFFDARFKDECKKIAVKVFSLSAPTIESFCLEFDTLRERFKAKNHYLHILIYYQDNLKADEWRKGISRIIRLTNRMDVVKPFFYSIAEDNSITPVEDMP